MTAEPFTGPAKATGINYEELKGCLLLVEVTGLEHNVMTVHGEKDAIRAHVNVLDGGQAGADYRDTLIFPKALIGQLRPKLGGMVLGRLGQGEAKSGQKPPWVLSEPTDADRTIGMAFLDKKRAAPPF